MDQLGQLLTGTGSPVSSGVLERAILRAGKSALFAVNVFAVIVTLQRHSVYLYPGAVELDLLIMVPAFPRAVR